MNRRALEGMVVPWREAGLAYWRKRQPREQVLLTALAVIMLLALGVEIGQTSMAESERLRAQLPRLRATLERLEAQPLPARHAQISKEGLARQLALALPAGQVKVDRDGVVLDWQGKDITAMMQTLDQVAGRQGMIVREALIERQGTQFQVHLQGGLTP